MTKDGHSEAATWFPASPWWGREVVHVAQMHWDHGLANHFLYNSDVKV